MTRFIRLATIFVTLFFAFCFSANAVNLTGIVKDAATGEAMIEASVRLLNAKDSAFVSGTTTNINGKFTLSNVKAGNYIVNVSYIGYADLNQPVKVGSSNVRLGELQLKESSQLLGEVSVVAVKTPIKVMEDTVEYNADSYHTQPNAVVEDLLKRLPGVEVGTDGAITANGKTVSKILIDGKEFFSDDPQVASKNLPANMVDKLQVVDRKSDMARLTGVDDGEDETVINLTFKKGMNQGWFGTAEAGYGSDSRYMGSFNVNRFWDGNQITLLGNFNNTNQIGFTDSNGNRFRRFGGNNGITQSRALGLNFNIGNGDILRVGGDIMWSNTDANTIKRQSTTTTVAESLKSYTTSNQHSRNRGNNVRADFRVLWKPDSFNTLEFRPNFSYNFNKAYNNERSSFYNNDYTHTSDNSSVDNSRGNSYEAGGRLIYSHSFKQHRGRSFSLSGQYRFSNVIEKTTSFSDLIRYIVEEDEENTEDTSELLRQYTDNHTWSNQVMGQFTWTEPLGDVANGNFLTFAYRMNYRWNNADKLVYNIPDDYELDIYPPLDVEPDREYSNRYRYNYFNQNIRFGYKKTGANSNLELGLALVPQMMKSVYIDSDRENINRWVWNYAPFLRYRYKFSKRTSLQANYRGQSSQPSMTQLQPVVDNSNLTNSIIGNPDLKPSFTHNVNLRFQDFNMDAQRSIMLMADIQVAQNSIITKTTQDQFGVKTTTYVNTNGVWSGRLMNMISMPLRNKLWSFSNHIFGNVSHGVSYTNGERNNTMNLSIMESPGITFRPDNFELELRPQYRVQYVHNSLQAKSVNNSDQAKSTKHNYGFRFDGSYYTSWGLTIQTDLNYTAKAGYGEGYNKTSFVWNATISQQFLRSRALTLAVKVYDILNQRNTINQNISGNNTNVVEYNSLPRYFMVTLSYRFNSFGKGNEPSTGGGFMHGRGPGGPGGHGGRGPR
ncbi:MAG: outer membrane beta-barrel protein [Staphylococcus sp.]|nr:outer membrane beta-barrel protein [Staphylococcus sp.]